MHSFFSLLHSLLWFIIIISWGYQTNLEYTIYVGWEVGVPEMNIDEKKNKLKNVGNYSIEVIGKTHLSERNTKNKW